MARRIAERSITLVKDSLAQIPLGVSQNSRILAVTVARRTDLSAGVAFNTTLRERVPGVRAELLAAEDPAADYGRMERFADSADVVLISSYMGHSWDAVSASAPQAFAGFVNRLTAKGKRPVVVSFGNPYLLQQIPGVPAYVVAWGGFPPSQMAAARAILGVQPVSGILPISIPLSSGTVLRGSGLKRPASR